MSALLDTCALIWWTLDPDCLSPKAYTACSKLENDILYISSISIWELGIKIKNKKIDIGMSIEKFHLNLLKLGYVKILAIDEKIWIKNLSLHWDHKDPADRTIVATAKIHSLPIITSDQVIKNYYHKVIW